MLWADKNYCARKLLQDMDRLYEELPELLLVGRAASREFTEATRER